MLLYLLLDIIKSLTSVCKLAEIPILLFLFQVGYYMGRVSLTTLYKRKTHSLQQVMFPFLFSELVEFLSSMVYAKVNLLLFRLVTRARAEEILQWVQMLVDNCKMEVSSFWGHFLQFPISSPIQEIKGSLPRVVQTAKNYRME